MTNEGSPGTDSGKTGNPPGECIEYLRASGLGAELTDEQIHTLSGVVNIRKMSKHDILISEGEHDNQLYVIAKGKFEVCRGGDSGQQITLDLLAPGAMVGELAFLDGLKRTATVRAATDESCVVCVNRHQLESILPVDPSLVYNVMRAIVRSAHRTVDRMDSNHVHMVHYIQS